ncbi:MAG: phage tail sheath family protein [Okeania sp. SIO2B3]|nr:phage tail sheath family protein [Okeania sp. SIO2B3]
MHYALQMFFNNGGSGCYIVSVGVYSDGDDAKKKIDFENGLAALMKEDEPTLILLTDAVNLSETDYYDLCKTALAQCNKLQDRFAILDVQKEEEESEKKTGEESEENTGEESEENIGDVGKFRDGIGQEYLNYGAAYYPYLQTSLNYYCTDDSPVIYSSVENGEFESTTGQGLTVNYKGKNSDKPKVYISIESSISKSVIFYISGTNKEILVIIVQNNPTTVSTIVEEWGSFSDQNQNNFQLIDSIDSSEETSSSFTEDKQIVLEPVVMKYYTTPDGLIVSHKSIIVSGEEKEDNPTVTIKVVASGDISIVPSDASLPDGTLPNIIITVLSTSTVQQVIEEWNKKKEGASPSFDDCGFNLDVEAGKEDKTLTPVESEELLEKSKEVTVSYTLSNFKTNTGLYNKIKSEISKERVILPPSAAMAGVYARVDRDRGVWKAPANVSLSSVTAPTIKITNEEQENLNVDANGGKSINAIRYFTGKGVLVWGARTLAGNDNEWRYVPVRRLFIYVEESVKKATEFAVFEPNVSTTWLKVKSMIENFLEGLWRQGALAGSTAQQAFFVNVGLNTTMSLQDILEGRMIVEIGLAAVRPAEFVILKFSHKLQEA